MVAAVWRGTSVRETARQFRVSLDTVQRAAGQRLDRVDWSDCLATTTIKKRIASPEILL
jgi:hypothetical protein